MELCRWWSVQETFIQVYNSLSRLWLWRLEPNCTDGAARAELWSVQLIGPDIENSRWWMKSGIRTRTYRALWPSWMVSSGRRPYNVGISVRTKIWAADSGLGLGLFLKGRGETVEDRAEGTVDILGLSQGLGISMYPVTQGRDQEGSWSQSQVKFPTLRKHDQQLGSGVLWEIKVLS